MWKFTLVIMIIISSTSSGLITESRSEIQTSNDIVPAASDITLSYSSFIGGSAFDYGDCIAIDDDGYIWVAGHSSSPNYPVLGFKKRPHAWGFDVVLSKFKLDGKHLVLSTFLGGDGHDYPNDIAIDTEGNVWIVGHTASTTFPTTTDALNSTHGMVDSIESIYDGFICKFAGDNSGTLYYSTYISTDPGSAIIKSCALDSNGDLWFTGYTTSSGFPTTSTAYDPDKTGNDWDIFVGKLSSDGSQLLYSTFFGGGGDDRAECLVIDESDNIWITGRTFSSNFPITLSNAYDTQFSGTSDAFISQFNFSNSNALQYSTFLGGSNDETGKGLKINSQGGLWILGDTSSENFPYTTNAYNISFNGGSGWASYPIYPSDIFLSLLNPANPLGIDLIYSTYIGGSGNDNANNLLLDIESNLWITGFTSSSNFPTTFKPPDSIYNGDDDVCILKFSPTGEDLKFSTYLGSSGDDWGTSLVYDNTKTTVWMTGFGEYGFQTTTNAYNETYGGYHDIVVVGLNDTSVSPVTTTTDTTTSDLSSSTNGSGTEETSGFSILVLLILLPLCVVIKKRKKKFH